MAHGRPREAPGLRRCLPSTRHCRRVAAPASAGHPQQSRRSRRRRHREAPGRRRCIPSTRCRRRVEVRWSDPYPQRSRQSHPRRRREAPDHRRCVPPCWALFWRRHITTEECCKPGPIYWWHASAQVPVLPYEMLNHMQKVLIVGP